jgi:hypothetical protein
MVHEMHGDPHSGKPTYWHARGELFAGLFILGCANGLAGKIIRSIDRLGWVEATLGTFDISAIVLISCFVGISLILRDKVDEIKPADISAGVIVLLLAILPIAGVNWLAVTALSLYILIFTRAHESTRRGATILLAVTVPMLWSRLLFDFFANFILDIDASLVGWILGTHRSNNMIEFSDHSGTLVIYPACSSLANMSLALLCWVTVSQSVGHRARPQDILWCLLACASVLAVNVTRLSLMGLSVTYYDAIHGSWGDLVANINILGLTVGISVLGVRREAFSRA